jgi:hypothetical protein
MSEVVRCMWSAYAWNVRLRFFFIEPVWDFLILLYNWVLLDFVWWLFTGLIMPSMKHKFYCHPSVTVMIFWSSAAAHFYYKKFGCGVWSVFHLLSTAAPFLVRIRIGKGNTTFVP